MNLKKSAEVIIVGGGLAGLSAGIYLGRARRDTIIIDSGKSMARWEPQVENFVGFPKGVGGEQLLERGRDQAKRYGIRLINDEVVQGKRKKKLFLLNGKKNSYVCKRLLVATGIFHIPPDLPGITWCLGHTMFFCKDCDGVRVQGKSIAVYGNTNEAVEYALSMLVYSSCVVIVTDGRPAKWDGTHTAWLQEYQIPAYYEPIVDVRRRNRVLEALKFDNGSEVLVEALFTTRGDIYFNKLARGLGAAVNEEGEVVTDIDMRTTVPGLYAAGCVTPANCQMIIAAGQGATAAQAINRDLFEESLNTHSLRRRRQFQLRHHKTRPHIRKQRVRSR